jgi:hypothetical protein
MSPNICNDSFVIIFWILKMLTQYYTVSYPPKQHNWVHRRKIDRSQYISGHSGWLFGSNRNIALYIAMVIFCESLKVSP